MYTLDGVRCGVRDQGSWPLAPAHREIGDHGRRARRKDLTRLGEVDPVDELLPQPQVLAVVALCNSVEFGFRISSALRRPNHGDRNGGAPSDFVSGFAEMWPRVLEALTVSNPNTVATRPAAPRLTSGQGDAMAVFAALSSTPAVTTLDDITGALPTMQKAASARPMRIPASIATTVQRLFACWPTLRLPEDSRLVIFQLVIFRLVLHGKEGNGHGLVGIEIW